jgi:hypothetical protein
MTVFIKKGDAPLSVRQATKRGMAHVAAELSRAGARKGDEELLRVIPNNDLPPRLAGIVHALGHISYAAYATGWEADNLINGANNLFNHQLRDYRAAKARLAQYRLAEGRPEVTDAQQAIDAQGAPVYDEETGEQTGKAMVANPAVAQDDAERADAQTIIDGTPAEVRAFAEDA